MEKHLKDGQLRKTQAKRCMSHVGEDNFHLAIKIKLRFHTYSLVSYVQAVYSRVTRARLGNEDHVLTTWWLGLDNVSISTGLPLSSI
jgi:hypothetical protein